MIYNKHELLLNTDENVRKAIPGIENGKEYDIIYNRWI